MDPTDLGLIPNIPQKISEEKNVAVAEVYQPHCLEESGQWLENVDQTHLVLASGKLVLQKSKAGGWHSPCLPPNCHWVQI